MKKLNVTVSLILLSILSGCASEPKTPKAGESVVYIKAQSGNEMLARSLDSERATSLNQFNISAGKHTMEVGLVKVGYQNSHRRCVATLTYGNFLPDSSYTLVENSSGADVKVALLDNEGKTVAETDKVPCL
ncbi:MULTISPECIES: hypothetical protein [Pseudomonas syringae group]|uniref:Lipoprotein n=1 Tax=Pseudomonas syringae pv. castaneae TaxID=264450 RepID=A0A0P9MML4_PSESX|nr:MULTISPECIES: hypothetical protein [Pseudomonas syringae group]KPW93282.1 Uncharacterized protein ALO79_00440 [Pseudomonas syringae pv. castaneae]KWS91745.1 hypothetical protein AL048_28600 [Pseudomonas syringae pv. castaneae]